MSDEVVIAVQFVCPGCKFPHYLPVNGKKNSLGAGWNFNGDEYKPTLTPSIMSKGGFGVCHSYVTDGKIQFLSDSTHELSGKTVELPNI